MQPSARALVVGEVLWDRFPDASRLGGAPLNFAVHLNRLGRDTLLVSAVGTDRAGEEALQAIERLGLDTRCLQSTARHATGSAKVHLGLRGETSFVIERPAAYDAVEMSDDVLEQITRWNPGWIYFGTLFPSCAQGKRTLDRLMQSLPSATRFYDLNLRPGFDAPERVDELLHTAHAVKLNEDELRFVHLATDLPSDPRGFLQQGSRRYGWRAACVTLGSRGCAMLVDDQFVEAEGVPVDVVDTVGAGDAFAAAFVHGLMAGWAVATVAAFSNRAGAAVAGVAGAIPDR
jgi:fructokinase